MTVKMKHMKNWILFVCIILVVFAVNAKGRRCVGDTTLSNDVRLNLGISFYTRCGRRVGKIETGHTRKTCEMSTRSQSANVFTYNKYTRRCEVRRCKEPLNKSLKPTIRFEMGGRLFSCRK